jgi:hypothetical protein
VAPPEPKLDEAAAAFVASSAKFVVIGGFGEIHGELPNDPLPGLET